MFSKSVARLARRVPLFLPLTVALACWVATAQAEVTISDQPTHAMKCAKRVCTPKKARANLNVTELANMLATGDVKVISDSAALDIFMSAPLSWTSTSRLTLDSYRSIILQKPIAVAGTGALMLATNDGGSGGDFWFEKAGHVRFWDLNSSLVIGGQAYTLVKNIKHLASAVKANSSGFFALAGSHDAKRDGVYSEAPVAGTFLGSFEGLGNSISNLAVQNQVDFDSVGLFARMDAGSTIRHVVLKNVSVSTSGAGSDTGSLVGESCGELSWVSADGIVSSRKGNAGGLAGTSACNNTQSAIYHSAFVGSVTAGQLVGGLAGGTYNATISDSHADVTVKGFEAGGLVGAGGGTSSVLYSRVVGDISGESAGGIAGDWEGQIKYSYSTASVQGKGDAGGIAGNFQVGAIDNSYATGSVKGGDNAEVGGLAGHKIPEIFACYSTGKVSVRHGAYIGGSIGYDVETYQTDDVYWDFDTSGIHNSHRGAGYPADDPGVTGLTDAQLKAGLPNGFDPNVWGERADINNGYPYLLANPPPK